MRHYLLRQSRFKILESEDFFCSSHSQGVCGLLTRQVWTTKFLLPVCHMLTEIESEHLESCITIGHCCNIQAYNCVFYKILVHNKLGKKTKPPNWTFTIYNLKITVLTAFFSPLLVALVVGLFIPLLLSQCRPRYFMWANCRSLLIDCFLVLPSPTHPFTSMRK